MKINDILLSVVVPVYNTGRYLPQCLDSILSQNVCNFELICVNDGSTDDSQEILQRYESDYPNVRIIQKINSGYGDSVNQGIRHARGKYVSIIESDDFVVEDSFDLLLELAERFDAEVVKGNYYNYFSDDGHQELWDNLGSFPKEQIINPLEYKHLFLGSPSIWSGIYRRSFLVENNITFLDTPGAAYQDTSFAFKVLACARRVVLTEKPIINYRQDNGQSSSNTSRNVFVIRKEYIEIERFILEQEAYELYPVMAKAKFISYAWNANRLDVPSQMKFWLAVSSEFQRLCEDGYICEQYFDENELATVQRIVYDLYGFCMNCKIKERFVPSTPELLPEILKCIGKVKYVDEDTDFRMLEKDDLLVLKQDVVESLQQSGLYGYCELK